MHWLNWEDIPQNEDYLKNEDDLKNEDNLKDEEDLKNDHDINPGFQFPVKIVSYTYKFLMFRFIANLSICNARCVMELVCESGKP